MKAGMLEPMLRDATIKAIDSVAKKLTEGEKATANAVGRLLTHWKKMETTEKEHLAGIVIATATTAATAIIALRRRAKSPVKSAGKALVKSVAKKIS
ncbi:MAG TPA: hypothetical protein VHL58_13745 [Thermoanaerobaculia bacterium]|nr:hypothetical protein [Thermoanaerobaculia bacterium]